LYVSNGFGFVVQFVIERFNDFLGGFGFDLFDRLMVVIKSLFIK